MRSTKFGTMARLSLPSPLSPQCEVMQFSSPGRAHKHGHDEVAVAVAGCGFVVMDGRRVAVKAGQFVHIPAGVSHYMEPFGPDPLAMFIGYSPLPPAAE